MQGCHGLDYAGISFVPCHITNSGGTAIFVGFALVTTPCCIFPFSLGGEAEILAGEDIEFFDKSLTIIPRYLYNRETIALSGTGVGSHHRLPQFLSHLGFSNQVGRQCYGVGGLFIACHSALLRSASHRKGATFNRHHFKGHSVHGESLNIRRLGIAVKNDIHEGGYITHIHGAIAIEVAQIGMIVGDTQNFVHEGCHIAHIHRKVGIHVTSLCCRGRKRHHKK